MKSAKGIDTLLVHGPEPAPRVDGSFVLPIFQSTLFETRADDGYHDIRYPRLNNLPNHVDLANKLAALEGGESALVTASGMAAISTTLISVLGQGGHLLAQDCLYGGTFDLIETELSQLGLSYSLLESQRPEQWDRMVQNDTRAIYVESLTNPLLQVVDHEAVVAFARRHGLIAIIDNTFATPINFQPLSLGFDLSVHSATKYLNGHSDLVAGAVVGRAPLVERIRQTQNHLGGCLSAQDCFMLARGLKTLGLRVRRQNENALAIAAFLSGRSDVKKVYHPSVAAHPGADCARRLFRGYGGMVSFELADEQTAQRLLDRMLLFSRSASLGGVESLITRPAQTSHAGMTEAQRMAAGISAALVRLSIGIEDPDDLIADLEQALA